MKFGRLIEYDIRNIFLEISYSKCGAKTCPRPFSGKSSILWIDTLKSVFIISQVEGSRNILKLSCKSLAFTSPAGMRRRSDVSFRSHTSWDVIDHAGTSSWLPNSYVNEADLFETSLRRLISLINLRHRNDVPIDT